MTLFRRIFARFSKKSPPATKRSFSESPKMSTSATAAALYAATVSSSTIAGATPEEAKEKRHHLKDGKGFENPWDSWKVMPGSAIAKEIIWWIHDYKFKAQLTPEGAKYQEKPIVPRLHLRLCRFENRTSILGEIPIPCAQPGWAMHVITWNFQGASVYSLTQSSASDVVPLAGSVRNDIQQHPAKLKKFPL